MSDYSFNQTGPPPYPPNEIHGLYWRRIVLRASEKLKPNTGAHHYFHVEPTNANIHRRMFGTAVTTTRKLQTATILPDVLFTNLCGEFGVTDPGTVHLSMGTFGRLANFVVKQPKRNERWIVHFDVIRTRYLNCGMRGCFVCENFAPSGADDSVCLCGQSKEHHTIQP